MASAATALMTADEFHAWVHRPENRDRLFELVRGEVVEMPRPGKRHGMVCGNITRLLGNYAAARRKGYVCSNDTGVVVERDPDTVRGPDVMFFEDAAVLDEVDEKYGDTPPLLAVEVLSPNDSMGKVQRRVREQFRFGTRLVWVLDPDACNVTVMRPGQESALFEETDELSGDDVLPDFRCKVAEIFHLPGQ